MRNTFGEHYRFTIFGESHGPAIGVTVEGLEPGAVIDEEALNEFLSRRAPGRGPHATPRKESDRPVFLSGLKDGRATGGVLTAVIYNENARPQDYEALKTVPRPGHADFTAAVKYGGMMDMSGGGPFSGRLTAPLCIAGGIALQQLEEEGVSVRAFVREIAGETDPEKMSSAIDAAIEDGDSVGGVISCEITGVPAGLGDPMFFGMENRIAQAVFAIPAVKGIAFGAGFEAARMRGSENNDAFCYEDGVLKTCTNHAGGILGGITTGMPVTLEVAVKPTPSIAKEQDSVDLASGENVKISVSGRHDPCIVPRAVPCVEAACACVIYDAILETRTER